MIYSYKLHFSSPLHISNERGDYASGSSIIHSDTLYSAIAWAWNLLGKSEWITDLLSDDFALSSCFPFCNNQLFFPRPKFSYEINREQLIETGLKKKIKKAEWVDEVILKQMLSGIDPTEKGNDNFSNTFWSSKPIQNEKFIDSTVVPRVMVPRNNDDTKIYYIEKYFFKQGSGLYFLASFENSNHKNQFEAALKLLADEGIGTDRNVGHGKFTFEVTDFVFPDINASFGLIYSLGLFIPQDQEEMNFLIDHPRKGYDLVKRSGWLSEPYLTWRKKQVYMFSEGSVFKSPREGMFITKGKTVDLKPEASHIQIDHPVLRCGKTIFLNF